MLRNIRWDESVKENTLYLVEALLCHAADEFEDEELKTAVHVEWVTESKLRVTGFQDKQTSGKRKRTFEVGAKKEDLLKLLKKAGKNFKLPQRESKEGKSIQQRELDEIQTALDCLKELGVREDEKSAKNKGYWKFTLTLEHQTKREENLKLVEQKWKEHPKTQSTKRNQEQQGNSNNIFNIFTKASTLSQYIRVKDFQLIVDEKTKNFVGRTFIFRSIDEFLENSEFPSGYIIISGEPGIGKSSLIAQLIKDRGYVHHFNSVLMGIRSHQVFLENICTQLIVRYELNYSALPPQAAKDSGFLSQLLVEVANQEQQKPIVILVDALDEAEDKSLSPGANRLFLPPNLPEGIFFIVTSREEYDYRLDVTQRKDIYLRDDDPCNLEDVRLYICNYVQEHQTKMLPHIEQWGVSQDEFVDVITEKSEGNFMYLVHVLHDIRDSKLTQSNVDSIHNLPKGLQSYYRRHWREMEVQDPRKFEQYYEPVVCQLAVAREPVSVNQLYEWTKLPPRQIKEIIRDWREFFNEFAPETGECLYRIYHASFQTFLREDIGLKPYEEKVVQTAFNKIQW